MSGVPKAGYYSVRSGVEEKKERGRKKSSFSTSLLYFFSLNNPLELSCCFYVFVRLRDRKKKISASDRILREAGEGKGHGKHARPFCLSIERTRKKKPRARGGGVVKAGVAARVCCV